METQGQRLRMVSMDLSLIVHMMTEGWRIPRIKGETIRCIKGLPEGTKYIGFEHGTIPDRIYFVVEHDSFEPLGRDEWIPEFPVEFEMEIG